MKASKSSDARKAFILKQGADGIPVADICCKAGISQAAYSNWRKRYNGLLPTEMRRLKLPEDEDAKLRKLVADLSLNRAMLQDNVTLDFSRPGKPTDNAFIEAFNGRFRAECLNAHWFMMFAGAREELEAWRR